jgi:hypothetical protein
MTEVDISMSVMMILARILIVTFVWKLTMVILSRVWERVSCLKH